MSCALCSPSRNVIYINEFWTVVLNDDQGYLGRCYFALNRHETDVTRLSQPERESLWLLFGAVKSALDQIWGPDHYNYVFLMNVEPHLHGHIIPRYAVSRRFDNIEFVDGELGKHYNLVNNLIPSDETLSRIAAEICSAFIAPETAQ